MTTQDAHLATKVDFAEVRTEMAQLETRNRQTVVRHAVCGGNFGRRWPRRNTSSDFQQLSFNLNPSPAGIPSDLAVLGRVPFAKRKGVRVRSIIRITVQKPQAINPRNASAAIFIPSAPLKPPR